MDGAVEAVQNQVLGAAAGWIQNFVQQTGLPQQMVEQLVMQVVGATANQMSGQTPLVTGEPGRPFNNAAAYQAAAQNIDALGAAGVAAAGAPARAAALGARTRQASGVTAYHGSPHDFDKFSMDKIGTGEGAQAYGRGLYFAENADVAKDYQKTLTQGANEIGQEWIEQYGSPKAALEALEKEVAAGNVSGGMVDSIRTSIKNGGNAGNLYEVNIKAEPDQFLDWDKPIAANKVIAFVHQLETCAKLRPNQVSIDEIKLTRMA